MVLRVASRFGMCTLLACASNEAPPDVAVLSDGGTWLDASVSSDGGPTFGDAGPRRSPPKCSADLRTVLDERGQPKAACPPDQGCLEGACVIACDAAAGSQSTIGCDYYAHQYAISVSNSDTWWTSGDIRGGCYAAVVVNTWSTPANLTVTRGGVAFPIAPFARVLGTDALGNLVYAPWPATGLPPNAAAAIFLSYDTRGAGKGLDAPCPAGVTAASSLDTAIHVTGYNDAFRLRSDRPINAYQVYPWGGARSYFPSATLLYPSTAWGTNYVAPAINDAYFIEVPGPSGTLVWENPFLTLVAREDTDVTLLAKVDIVGNTATLVAPAPKNTPVTYSIKEGQYLQLLQHPNLGGTIVSSTRPVGMFIGSQQFKIPGGDGDNQGQMVPPVRSQGSEYVGASYDLPSAAPWQLVGAVDGTVLTYDPAPPPGAPATIARGDVVEFASRSEFVVRSQDVDHPFYAAVYKRGDDSAFAGGPDFVNLVPPVQFRSQYVFVTDPTYATTTLVFVREKGAGDVTLDCVGTIRDWKAIGSGAFEVARVVFGAGNTCKNGAHEAKGAGTFGITVWGWAYAASYGYPAGGNSLPVNDVVVPPAPR